MISFGVVGAIPLHEAGDTLFDGRGRCEAGGGFKLGGIGIRSRNIPLLEWQEIFDGLAAEVFFQGLDVCHELDW